MPPNPDQGETVDSIRSYYGPLVIHAEAASREYAQLALRSIITLNAGVAVAYPAIIEVFIEKADLQDIMLPTALAVFGAVFGVICGYVVFFNHSAEADSSFNKMMLEISKVDGRFDQNAKAHFEQQKAKQDARRNRLFVVASLLGVLSLFSFCISVFSFAFAALG